MRWHPVSILVLVDLALESSSIASFTVTPIPVSILVLVDLALELSEYE